MGTEGSVAAGRRAQRWIATGFGGPEVLVQDSVRLARPRRGEVTIEVRAAGINPADYKHFAPGQDPSRLPLSIGYEVAGVISDLGPRTQVGSGPAAVGDEVVAFPILGGYASALTVDAADVFAKPPTLSFAEAANLLLVGTTAAELLHTAGATPGDVVLLHGAAGAVGTSVLQQARLLGLRVVGTADTSNFDNVRRYGATPVRSGEGLEERVRNLVAPGRVTVALDTVGSDEAVDTSLALVPERERIVTIAAAARARRDGIRWIGGSNPASGPFRASQRERLLRAAGKGELHVPIARTFPLDQAPTALEMLMRRGRPYGKLALVSNHEPA
jgi:NADPH:quinone reductase